MKPSLVYPAKVLLAWGEAISGNVQLREWLMTNQYSELGIFVFALHNKDSARKWLLDNGFPHLMAMINGAEGVESALEWLDKNGYKIMEKIARGADNDNEAIEWLIKNNHRELSLISLKMRTVKNQIERENNDIHKISGE